jgi:hypothetical protein
MTDAVPAPLHDARWEDTIPRAGYSLVNRRWGVASGGWEGVA